MNEASAHTVSALAAAAARVAPAEPADSLDAQLDAYLKTLLRDDCFRVDAVLKQSAAEVTQRVYFVGANGAEQGPYVRKLLRLDAHVGDAYRAVYQARCSGKRFRFLPEVYECHEAGDRLVVVMEYVRGATLRSVVEKTLPERRIALAARAFPSLCAAAAELHESFAEPLVHRDLTPSNIMCAPDDPAALTVIDLGIARLHRPEADADTTHFGTRPYAPPEQYGFGQTDARTDVYALGLVLFFCLTGRDATSSDRERSYADSCVPEPLRAVIAHAAALDPAARYASARALGEAFDRARDQAATALLGPAVPREPAVLRESAAEHSRRSILSVAADAAARIGELSERVPAWLGRLWNLAILLIAAFLAVACALAVVDPVPQNDMWPLWFRIFSYAVFLPVLMAVPLWLLVDKRRLARRFPALYRLPFWKRALRCAVVVGVAFITYVGVGIGSGVAVNSGDVQAGTRTDQAAVRVDA